MTIRTRRDIGDGQASGRALGGQRVPGTTLGSLWRCANGCIWPERPRNSAKVGHLMSRVVVVVISHVGSISDTGDGGARS